MIRLNDLYALHKPLEDKFTEVFDRTLKTSRFIGGEAVACFERQFAVSSNAEQCIAVANGTDAIEIALRALNLQVGDEVIVPSLTWISTAEAVTNLGGTPVFADCETDSYSVDANSVAKLISEKTVGIIVVHLHGSEVDTETIGRICNLNKLWFIEDCAQAHLLNKYSSSMGKHSIACTYSFFPGKNLGAFGDAGAITTNNDRLAETCRLIANHGTKDKVHHYFPGRNSRMDTFQAEVLLIKLEHLSHWTEKRRSIASQYEQILSSVKQIDVFKKTGRESVYHQFVIGVKDRDVVRNSLLTTGIETGIHYATPLPLLDAYVGSTGAWQVALTHSQKMISLPCHPHLTDDEISKVCSTLIRLVT